MYVYVEVQLFVNALLPLKEDLMLYPSIIIT